jgi:sirohydrochlorin ferrochelatase
MAEPRLEAVLAEARQWPVRRVVVQPHLLFGGVLLDRIRQQVADQAARAPEMEWICTAHLGPHPFLTSAIVDRAVGAN